MYLTNQTIRVVSSFVNQRCNCLQAVRHLVRAHVKHKPPKRQDNKVRLIQINMLHHPQQGNTIHCKTLVNDL